jgi:hypothetical protein
MSAIIEGLQILSKYFKGGDGYHCGAEHDEFTVWRTDMPIEPVDLARLCELGWIQSGKAGNEDFAPKHYDPKDGWTCFT